MAEGDADIERDREEVREYLSRIRKTIEESNALVDQTNLRLAETDRLLAAQGLTREQVSGFKFTREQRLAANEELRRMGLPVIEDDEAAFDFDAAMEEVRAGQLETADGQEGDVVDERRRKFGNFMQAYRL